MASLPKKWRTPRKTKVFLIPSLYNPLAKAQGPGRRPAGICSRCGRRARGRAKWCVSVRTRMHAAGYALLVCGRATEM